jgi:ATP synthase protein I
MQSIPARIIFWQVLVGLVGAVLWSVGGLDAALAALAGGLASALLSLQFALRIFSRRPDAPAGELLGTLYRAEALKLVMAAVLFIIAARFFGHVFVPLVTTYMATLLVYWVALLWKLDH